MCIAIIIPPKKGKFLTDEMLEDCYLVNSDGIGYAIPDGKGGVTVKKFMEFDEFMEEWGVDKKRNKKFPIMLHFRATSVGDTNLDNCHPFVVNKKQVFCHNGTISKVAKDVKGGASDTRMFNRLFLRNLPTDWEHNLPITTMMEHYIGGSKLIVLNADKSFYIVNEDLGTWDGGIWFSNEHYTGLYTRGAGVAYKKTVSNITPSNFNRHSANSQMVITAASRRAERRKDQRQDRQANQRRIAYEQDPKVDISGSSEAMCEWCSTPYDESELILTDYGNSEHPFTLCHTCANKVQYDRVATND